jgi:very-short-patch-repair endonuclease
MPYYTFDCVICGKRIENYYREPNRNSPKYCSAECAHKSQIKKRIPKICAQCGKSFISKDRHIIRGTQKYCSQECVGLSQRSSPLICQNCGKEYFHIRGTARIYSKYCSKKCRQENCGVVLACEICGKNFRLSPSTAKERKHCSRKCAAVAAKKSHIFDAVCQNCGKEFRSRKSKTNTGKTKYCSKYCAFIGRKKEFIGPQHPAWKRTGRICGYCNTEFFSKNKTAKYCSIDCLRSDKKGKVVELTCGLCGKIFYKTEAQIKPKGYGQFCSNSCRQIFTCKTKFRKNPSSLEIKLIDALNKANLAYEFQYSIKNMLVDFAFPKNRLAVETDGKYWHTLPKVQECDRRKNAQLHKRGWTVLRFTEDEINQDVSKCVDQIIAHLNP